MMREDRPGDQRLTGTCVPDWARLESLVLDEELGDSEHARLAVARRSTTISTAARRRGRSDLQYRRLERQRDRRAACGRRSCASGAIRPSPGFWRSRPRRPLEIGCGSGLLLHQIAPVVRALHGDGSVEGRAGSDPRARSRLATCDLVHASADDFSALRRRDLGSRHPQLGRPVLPERANTWPRCSPAPWSGRSTAAPSSSATSAACRCRRRCDRDRVASRLGRDGSRGAAAAYPPARARGA